MIQSVRLWAVSVAVLIGASALPAIQADEPTRATPALFGGPFTGKPVLDAPFTADATTTVRGTLGDGSPINRTMRARYYRNTAGQVRVEQIIARDQARVTIHRDPAAWWVYLLDSENGGAAKGPRSVADLAVGGGTSFAIPLGPLQFYVFTRGLLPMTSDVEHLGTQIIEGLSVAGRRFTSPSDEGTYERWESSELGLLIAARHAHPGSGVIEYRLTNLRRVEPSADLFTVPVERQSDDGSGRGCWISLVRPEAPQWRSTDSGCIASNEPSR